MTMPAPGDTAPNFNLTADDGHQVTLADFKGKKIILYFYPKDDTSGCTREAVDFNAAKKAFAAAGAVVVGVSPDGRETHCKFKEKHALGITLLADPGHQAIDAYGVWVEKSMYGRKYMGVERSTFLIGTDRRITQSWRKVRVPGHVEEVLAAAKAL